MDTDKQQERKYATRGRRGGSTPPNVKEYHQRYARLRRRGRSKPPEYWEAHDERIRKLHAGELPPLHPSVKLTPAQKVQLAQAEHEWHNRYTRVYQKRKKGKIICYWCEQLIPAEKLKKHKQQKFCDAACDHAHKRAVGFYFRLSRYGHAKQQQVRRRTGHAPGHEQRTYQFDQMSSQERTALGKRAAQAHWEGHQNDPKWSRSRRYYWKKKFAMNQQVVRAIQEELDHCRKEQMDAEDMLWMAIGAAIREGREQGVIGEELSPEMDATLKALVEREMKAEKTMGGGDSDLSRE